MNAFEIAHLTKRYQDFALEDVTFSLPEGCIMGLIGENGAGKSTTIRLLMNAGKKDGGTMTVLGQDNESSAFQEVKQDIGIVLDEANYPELLTAQQIGKIMKYTFVHWEQTQYDAYLKRFSLPQKKIFKEFSRGMKMKLAIAVALSHHAKLLVLDEATSGLDPIARDEILDILMEFTREENHSILLSSHIVSDLEKVCDYIAFLHQGKLLFCEEKDRLLEEYGILRCTRETFDALPAGVVQGTPRASQYGGIEALVARNRLPAGLQADRAGIEDIILYLARKGRTE